MEDHRILQFGDSTQAHPHSFMKNREDKISRIEATDCANNESNTRTPEVSSLQQNGSRTKEWNVKQQLVERKKTSHCMALTDSGEVYTRRKSEYQLRMSLLTTLTRTRRRSSGEIGRNCDKGRRNIPAKIIPVRISDRAIAMQGLLAGVNLTKTASADENQKAGRGKAPESCQATTPTNARPSISHKELVLDRRKRGEVNNYHREQSIEKRQHASEPHVLHWPYRVSESAPRQNDPHAELTRTRSASDSEARDSVLPFEKREKLERLKTQVYENNLKRENGKARENRGSFQTRGDKIFPVLEHASVMRYSRSHATIKTPGSRNGVTSEARLDETGGDVHNLYPTKENQNSAAYMGGYDIESTDNNESIRDLELLDVSSKEKESEACPTLGPQQADSEHYRPQEELKRPHVHVSSKNELVDLQSIGVIINRLQNAHRARSEPGDVGSRKPSTMHLLNRARSETDNLKIKVQKFVTKPLPALPPSTLRVNKSSPSEEGSSKGFSKAGVYATTSERSRENIDQVVNIHTCPSLNLFSGRSWMYQGKERKKHRYIRGPATPIPPVEFVFSKKDSNTASD